MSSFADETTEERFMWSRIKGWMVAVGTWALMEAIAVLPFAGERQPMYTVAFLMARKRTVS